MCELFAMSSRKPALIHYSLNEFSTHGGYRNLNRDGWGAMFQQAKDAYLYREPEPADDSALAKMVASKDIPSKYVIAHVRRATNGKPLLENTHPFRRIRYGRVHHFAHNGDLEGYLEKKKTQGFDDRSLGTTDSEMAFMDLLDRLDTLSTTNGLPSLQDRLKIFAEFSAEASEYGAANFLYCDGEALFVHAHKRRYETESGLSEPMVPGLHMRKCKDCGETEEWSTLGANIREMDAETILFASVPLNDAGWHPLSTHTALAIKNGRIEGQISSV